MRRTNEMCAIVQARGVKCDNNGNMILNSARTVHVCVCRVTQGKRAKDEGSFRYGVYERVCEYVYVIDAYILDTNIVLQRGKFTLLI